MKTRFAKRYFGEDRDIFLTTDGYVCDDCVAVKATLLTHVPKDLWVRDIAMVSALPHGDLTRWYLVLGSQTEGDRHTSPTVTFRELGTDRIVRFQVRYWELMGRPHDLFGVDPNHVFVSELRGAAVMPYFLDRPEPKPAPKPAKVKVPSGPGLKVLSKRKWYGGGYCGVCGGDPVPQQVRYWDCDDGWKVGVLCRECREACRQRGPRPDDFALRQDQDMKAMKADVLAMLGDEDATYSEFMDC